MDFHTEKIRKVTLPANNKCLQSVLLQVIYLATYITFDLLYYLVSYSYM